MAQKKSSKKRKKSKKLKRIIRIGSLILILILFILFIKFILGLFNKSPEKVSLIIGESKIELKKDILVDKENNIYLSKDDIAYLYDENIYYNPTDKTIITTYNKHIAVLSIGKTTMTVNDTAVAIKGALKEEKGTLYLPFSDMTEVYDFEYNYDKDSKALTVDSTNKEKNEAVVLKKTKLKAGTSIFSKKLEKMDKATTVTVFETVGKYTKVRTDNGNIGYIKTNKLSKVDKLRDNFEDEVMNAVQILTEYNEIKTDYGEVLESKDYLAVNPELFTINSKFEVNQVINLESDKFTAYKTWADNNNVKICAEVNFDGSMNELCTTYNNRTLVINNLYRELVKNQISAIDIDFENVDDTEGFYRFIIEMVPRFKEAGIKVFVTYKDGMNKDRLNNIVDYVL